GNQMLAHSGNTIVSLPIAASQVQYGASRGGDWLEAGRLSEIDTESVPPPLIAPGHLS
ncbi:MAG: hypothetical protein JWQ65_403, partial [Devosia sp.]|nr:hypothetical protein [Devosia sp.]